MMDCSKIYRTTYDEIFTVELTGRIASSRKILEKICKADFELFLISHFLRLRKICLKDFYFTLHEF